MQSDRQKVINRLKRIEGQVKGIIKMVEDQQSCSEVLMQVAAVRSAVNGVGSLIFETHFRQCLENAAAEGKSADFIDEVMNMLGKYIV